MSRKPRATRDVQFRFHTFPVIYAFLGGGLFACVFIWLSPFFVFLTFAILFGWANAHLLTRTISERRVQRRRERAEEDERERRALAARQNASLANEEASASAARRRRRRRRPTT